MTDRPLEGVRIVDFTWVRAGPWGTRQLAALGAQVVKVEWPDPKMGMNARAGKPPPGVPPGLNSEGGFNDAMAMKQSVTINTRSPRGFDALKRLIAVSDVVIENFSAGVLKSWGLSFPEMQAIKPDIIYVSMAGFGQSGPRADYVSMGPTVQAICGLTFLSGLPGKQPAGWGWSFMDDTGGMYAAICVLTALLHKQHTGEGQHVDMSQIEAGMGLLGPAFLDYSINGRGSRRPGYPPGNRSVWPGTPVVNNYRGPICAPHNAYRTAGGHFNDWIAIVCETDEEWRSFVQAMGSPAWADSRFDTLDGRLQHQEEMDRLIQEWTLQSGKYELTDLLQAAGVRAIAVQGTDDKMERDPQLKFRGHYDAAPHPVMGPWPLQQEPWVFSDSPSKIERGAPLAGEHNKAILCDLLGLTPEELRAGYEDNSFWPQAIPVEPYLLEALDEAAAKGGAR